MLLENEPQWIGSDFRIEKKDSNPYDGSKWGYFGGYMINLKNLKPAKNVAYKLKCEGHPFRQASLAFRLVGYPLKKSNFFFFIDPF